MMSTVSVISQMCGRDALLFIAIGAGGRAADAEVEGRGRRSEPRPLDERGEDVMENFDGEMYS